MHKMSGCQVSYVFFFFAVAITVVAEEYGDVSISDTTVKLTCPVVEDIEGTVTWYKDTKKVETGYIFTITDYTDNKEELYYCKYTNHKRYYFFIKAKVCEGCVDLDMMVAFAVVFADMLITLGIVLMVYYCAQKKAGTAAPQRAKQARQARGQARGPPTPDPDYQMLNPATRSSDVYAQAQRR